MVRLLPLRDSGAIFRYVVLPPGNQTAALLGAFGAYAAGFLVRPFGALIFGRIGDLVGRKYTFLVTIVVMGLSTVFVGFLPTYASIGFAAAGLLVAPASPQGLALGGEYGGAATYVAEHAPDEKRGYATAWIQTTATLGMLVALVVIGLCRVHDGRDVLQMGLAHPVLALDPAPHDLIYIRLKLQESPIFQRMKAQGKRSTSPDQGQLLQVSQQQVRRPGAHRGHRGAGRRLVHRPVLALFFLLIYPEADFLYTYALIGLSLLIGTPFFLVFGALSDRIGRLKIILAGCLIAALTYFPLFKGLTHYVNPGLEKYQETTPITVQATDCNFHIFIGPWSRQTPCDRAKDFLGKAGLSFTSLPAGGGDGRHEVRRHRAQGLGRSEIQGGPEVDGLSAESRPLQGELVHDRAHPSSSC